MQVLDSLTDASRHGAWLKSFMASANASFLFASPPATFRYLLQDALVVLGLPYGPQVREELARALPDLFGRSRVTLTGYQRWLARNAALDTLERFSEFMETRYQCWLSASITRPPLNEEVVAATLSGRIQTPHWSSSP
jgi:hypothetical protein